MKIKEKDQSILHISCCTFVVLQFLLEPHNPRSTPTQAMINIASAILGMVYMVLLSQVLTIRTPPA